MTPPLPESDSYTSSSTSQQPSSSINNINGLISNICPRFTFQYPSTPEKTSVTTHPCTQAQNTSNPNTPTIFNNNTIHTNPPPNLVNSRTLSRHPLQTIPTNPLEYNLSSTNTHNTQHSIHSLDHNAQLITSNNSIQHHNVPVSSSSSIKTNPYFTPTTQFPTNTINLQTNTSHSNYHITHPYAPPSTTVSNPTYITSSTSISEPIKPFDGLDHKYTPEDYLQHIEVEKGWYNEIDSNINLKCNEIFTKCFPKNHKCFANKRQVKRTSTVLKPSIPFHLLVKLVDDEDIANDKIRTQDLTLEVNSITNQLQSQNFETQQSEHLMFTQPRDPDNEHKPAYEKY